MCSVITLYSKGGGKAGRHDWVPQLPAEYRPTLICCCLDLSTAGFSTHPPRRSADWSLDVRSSYLGCHSRACSGHVEEDSCSIYRVVEREGSIGEDGNNFNNRPEERQSKCEH